MKLVEKVSMGELIRFMGMRLKIATSVGFERRDFWSVDIEGSKRKTPFKFNNLMSKHRFEDILRNLHFSYGLQSQMGMYSFPNGH